MYKGLGFYLFIFNIVEVEREKKFCEASLHFGLGRLVSVEGSYMVILKQIHF